MNWVDKGTIVTVDKFKSILFFRGGQCILSKQLMNANRGLPQRL